MPASEKLTAPKSPGSLRWRRARQILIGMLAVATSIGVFYTEENWRGKSAWENSRRQLEAQGGVFDWQTRIPPPVPDEQNIFKAPRMTEWFVGRGTNELLRRLANPTTSTVNSTNAPQTEPEARNYLAWSDQFAPDFDLIRTALKRPYARIECDYGQPTTVLAPNFLPARILVQTLAQRAHCFLVLGEPDKALGELTLLHDFCRIFEGAPSGKPITLVAAMIHVAVAGLYADTIADGLRMRAWRDEQLSALEQQLGEIHLETGIAETFVDEPMFTLRTLETASRTDLAKLLRGYPDNVNKPLLMLKLAPRGWFYQYMAFHARLNQEFAAGFDATNQTVSPGKIDEVAREFQYNLDHVSPHNFMAPFWTPNWGKALQRYCVNQTSVNETAIACALERYRLARDEYPETLAALMPQFIAKLPHDIIGGGPLKYRSTGGRTFALYSVGWDEKDDGGTPAKTVGQGDWVWGNPINL